MEQLLNLTKVKRDEIAIWLETEITIAISARSSLDTDLEEYYKLYEMVLPPDKTYPWPNASKVFVPLIPDKVDALVSRVCHSALKPDPLFTIKGLSPEAEKFAPYLEAYYSSKVKKLKYRKELMKVIQLAIRDGTSFIEVNRIKKNKEQEEIEVDESGLTLSKKVLVTFFDDDIIEACRLKDVYLIPAHAESVDKAYGTARRFWLRPHEANSQVKSGYFYSDIKDSSAPASDEKTNYIGSGKEDTSTDAIAILNANKSDIGTWECFSVLIRYDLNDNGNVDWYRFLIQKRDRVLLRAEKYDYKHNKLNLIPFTPMPRPMSPYGISLVGRLENIQREINADRNQRRDALTISISPPIKRLATSPTKLESKPWGPAQIYDVNDHRDMEPMQLTGIPPEAFAEESSLLSFADRISASPTFPLIKEASAREVSATQGDATLKFELIMQNILEAISEIGLQIFWLDKQFITSEGYSYTHEKDGNYVTMYVPPEAFEYDYEIRVNGNFVTFDKERRRQDLLFFYDLLLKNPLLAGISNVIPPNIKRIYHLTKFLCQEWGIQDIDNMIGKEENYGNDINASPSAEVGGLVSSGGNGGMAGDNVGADELQALFGNPAMLSAIGGSNY